MQVIYALFERYTDARESFEVLSEQGYHRNEMNVVVQTKVAKEYIDLDLSRVAVKVTDAVGEKTVQGFAPFLAVQRPIPLPATGEVYASGELATILVKTATAHAPGTDGLKTALEDFVPPNVASAFADGIDQGGVLFWLRVDDTRAGLAAQTLRRHHGKHVGNYVD